MLKSPRQRISAATLLALTLQGLPVSIAWAEDIDAPLIVDIVFEGNEKTRDMVLRREVALQLGDSFDPERAEAARQQIQNLGLFRSVALHTEPQDGGVRLVYVVDEKWFWQVYPRLSANSDGQNSVGVEGRVSNIWGLNHTLRLLARSRDTREQERGRDLSVRGVYQAPNVFGDGDGLRIAAAHNVIPYEAPAPYDETVDEIEVLAYRTYGLPNRPSQGWTVGFGPIWRQQQVSDEAITRSFGASLGAVAEMAYKDGRDLIYSNDGTHFSARWEVADQAVLSDYSYSVLRIDWGQARMIGTRSHQQLSYGFGLGVGNHALDHRALFSLGGSEGLKGYERKAFEGNSYYLGYLEFMRPLIWNSLRGTIGVEIGNAAWETGELFDTPSANLNVGLRLRPRRLVNFELELGFAIPINGDDPRFYGGKVDRP
ncbi:POTRA domain-containing protein [Panacagrimonas sp.]|uniref:POTRA domain-containing protein n=1 Tax=Panacagrimonas sp. TaxID=2480088 RepID=UPI003B52751C